MPQPIALPVWKKLEKYHRSVRERSIGGLFQNDPDRFSKMNLTLPGLLVDFSKTNLDSEGLRLLVELARAQNVEGWRDRMFAGAAINTTENQPVLHTALRRPKNDLVTLAGRSIMPDIHAVLNQMRIFSEQIRSGAWLGYRGATPTDIVVIGIGGQEVGLHTAVRALGAFRHPGLRTHFVANVDGHVIAPLLATLDPHRTLFMVSSKTFSTPETLINANRAKA